MRLSGLESSEGLTGAGESASKLIHVAVGRGLESLHRAFP